MAGKGPAPVRLPKECSEPKRPARNDYDFARDACRLVRSERDRRQGKEEREDNGFHRSTLNRQAGQLGGYFSNFLSFGSIKSHGCASEAHMCTCGVNKLGSSKLEAAMPWPVSVAPPKSREPYSGQNPRLL